MQLKSPDHYHGTDLMDLLIKHNVPFAEGNVMKYAFRWKQKDGLKDLYKCRDYLNAVIAAAEFEQAGNFQQLLSTEKS